MIKKGEKMDSYNFENTNDETTNNPWQSKQEAEATQQTIRNWFSNVMAKSRQTDTDETSSNSSLEIKTHDFEDAKQQIKYFSEQAQMDFGLKRVDESKDGLQVVSDWFFGRGIGLKHTVTGEELNDLTAQIQTHLTRINSAQLKTIQEFGIVYRALESLDKDYIKAILASIKATEKTSKSLQETQGQIKKIVVNQRKTLEELVKFKQKLNDFAHLDDIDKLWNDYQKLYLSFNTLSESIINITEISSESAQKAEQAQNALTAIEKKIVDSATRSSVLDKKLDSFQDDVNSLTAFVEQLSKFEHLMEIDELWKKSEANCLCIETVGQTIKIHTDQLNESQKRDENLATIIQKNQDELNDKIAEAMQTHNTAFASLTNRLKYAYWVAGGSACLAVIELILLFTKVI